MLPHQAAEAMVRQMEWRRALHERDLARGFGRVDMPTALARKFPHADCFVAVAIRVRIGEVVALSAHGARWPASTFMRGR